MKPTIQKSQKVVLSTLLLGIVFFRLFSLGFAADRAMREYIPEPGEAKTGVLDFSWLNEKPAGRHGHVLVDGERFIFEDGTPIKFFGVVLGFGAATPEKEVAEAIVRELASNGVNFVRLHAIDCTYSGVVDYSGIKEGAKTNCFNSEMLDRLDYLVYCCKENGIYIHLDTNAGRVISTGDGFSEEEAKAGQTGTLRGMRFFVDRIAELETQFSLALLDHENPYTKMRYADDPVIAVVQYVNESSVLWLNSPNVDNPFTQELNRRFNEWLKTKYESRENLKAAWTNEAGVSALREDEDFDKGSVASPTMGCWVEPTIEQDASFTELDSPPRHADFTAFLIEIEQNVFSQFYQKTRALGFKSAINCSNYPSGPVDTYLNSFGDVMEKNAYWNHPIGDYTIPTRFHRDEMASIDPRSLFPKEGLDKRSQKNDHALHSVGIVSRASVVDKPLIVTEWNATSPTEFRTDTLYQMACYGSFQDWDGLCVFIYTFDGYAENFFKTKSFTSFFNVNVDPAIYGAFGMAAAVFRLGLIDKARNQVELVLTPDDLLAQDEHFWQIPMITPFVSRFAYRFIDNVYKGNADLVIPSQNTTSGDYRSASHLLIEKKNPYSNAFRQRKTYDEWLALYRDQNVVSEKIGEQTLEFGQRAAILNSSFSSGNYDLVLTRAMRHFGLLTQDQGWTAERAVSDTGQLIYDVEKGFFSANSSRFSVFAGKCNELHKTDSFQIQSPNDRAAVAVLALDGQPLKTSSSVLVYAMGRCYNSGMTWDGTTLTSLGKEPILYEDIRGTLMIQSDRSTCCVWKLDSLGRRTEKIIPQQTDKGFNFPLGDTIFYELSFE
ncbi:MAG: hypothetical protein Q4C95_02300 [Planctomycetia bacterium]|nr:hypothetical protein [Planctomycetia bacterium]